MSKQLILTGLRSNDKPTLGNYLGAILPMVDMANKHAGEYQLNMFVPDLHSFTTPIDHTNLYANTVDNIKLFIACGLPYENPDVYIYRQSFIPAHSELAWILSCFTGFGEANRMVEFKDKSAKIGDDRVSVGLFNYPILMAADILLYGAEWIPVGEDQRQHLELARTLATRINNKFGDIFKIPKSLDEQQRFINRDSAPRIRSLKYPDKKMSKSVDDPAGTILLSDDPKQAAKKVMSATTDSVGVINFDWKNQPGITNLLQILALLTNSTQSAINNAWVGKNKYGELKSIVAAEVEIFLANLQININSLVEKDILDVVAKNEACMNQIASDNIYKVQKSIGLR